LAILAATALHAGILLVARAMPPMSLLQPSDLRELQTIDIELPATLPPELREPAPLPPEKADEQAPRPTDQPEARVAARGAAAPTPAGPQPPATAEPVAPGTNPPPGPAPTSQGPKFDDLPEERRGVLGVPDVPGLDRPLWAAPGVLPTGVAAAAPAPTVAPAPRPVDKDIAGKVIRDALSKIDKEKGIDQPAGGTVSAAVSAAVRSSDVPDVARGTIEVRLGPNGQVLSVRVVTMVGGNADQWQRVAAAAKAALAGKALPMLGEYAKGATVTVNVTSTNQPPAGGKGGWNGGTGASFDLSNIGAHATRNVRSSFTIAAAR
jgi:hypothetical protein